MGLAQNRYGNAGLLSGPFSHTLGGSVGRAVVDDDDLEFFRRDGLLRQRVQAAANDAYPVENRDDD